MLHDFSRPLFLAEPPMLGGDVLRLQSALSRHAASVLGEPDGVFGRRTDAAVKEYQRSRGLEPDGIVGIRTWATLFGAAGSILVREAAPAAAQAIAHLDDLRKPHRVFADSVAWSLTPQGIVVEGEAIDPGEGAPAERIVEKFAAPIGAWAKHYAVPVELIVATIATESSGDPLALREEPGYRSDEATPDKISVGLMQTLISTAAGALGRSLTRQQLLDPATSIEAGTAYIKLQSRVTRLDPPAVACAYNAGQLLHQSGKSNRWKMRQYPIGSGEHADRFVRHFNGVFAAFGKNMPFDDGVPSFYRALNP
jgi:hypothetical protein